MKRSLLTAWFIVGCSIVAIGQQTRPVNPTFDKNVKILFKPKPSWGDGQDCSTGAVILRIEFLATGKIGQIFVVRGITENRTVESIKAAHKIRFRPAKKDGKKITLFRMVEFSFSLY